ncbi:MAG: class II fumarate hydratase, partial [Proteobacteria bacterium]
VIVFNVLNSIRLISDACESFQEHCVEGIQVNKPQVKRHLENSLMLVTALNPHVGYDNAAKIAKYAHENDTTLKDAAQKLNLMEPAKFDELVRPEDMLGPIKK